MQQEITPNRLEPGELVDEHAAAEILALSVQTLRNWRWTGKGGPSFAKLGRLVRYRRSDLQTFIEAGTVDPAAKAAA